MHQSIESPGGRGRGWFTDLLPYFCTVPTPRAHFFVTNLHPRGTFCETFPSQVGINNMKNELENNRSPYN